jgi:hypothetical protein
MSLLPSKYDTKVYHYEITVVSLVAELEIIPEARSESNSKSNKKKLVPTLVHFLRRKTTNIHKL